MTRSEEQRLDVDVARPRKSDDAQIRQCAGSPGTLLATCPKQMRQVTRYAAPFVVLAMIAFSQNATFRTTAPNVLVPTTVTDAKGMYIDGLSADDFVLLDNGVPQRIRLDTADSTTIPLAVVFCVQADDVAMAAILKIRKAGAVIQPLIMGERGHAAVVTYASKPTLAQDFASDPEEITRAFRNIVSEDERSAAMLDAVAESATLLAMRPPNERRILVVIGESRDRGSKTRIDDVLKLIERQSITVFPVVYSAYVTPFTTKGSDLPPPSGGGGGLIPMVTETARLAKINAASALAGASGGRKMTFATLHSLEKILGRVGEELHSQYLLSYAPETGQYGYHTVVVKLRDRPTAVVRNRPGYWSEP